MSAITTTSANGRTLTQEVLFLDPRTWAVLYHFASGSDLSVEPFVKELIEREACRRSMALVP